MSLFGDATVYKWDSLTLSLDYIDFALAKP